MLVEQAKQKYINANSGKASVMCSVPMIHHPVNVSRLHFSHYLFPPRTQNQTKIPFSHDDDEFIIKSI